jgi:hypothetical protein
MSNFYDVKEKISCLIWTKNEWKGVDLSMLGISNFIIKSAEQMPLSLDYFYLGLVFSFIISTIPVYYHNTERFEINRKLVSANHSESLLNLSKTVDPAELEFDAMYFLSDPVATLVNMNLSEIAHDLQVLKQMAVYVYEEYVPFKKDLHEMYDTVQFWTNIELK